MATHHDLVVIGAGPGGYVAAIRAAQLGMNVGCVEKESSLGGTCLRVGCIPSKALLEASGRWVETRGGLEAFGICVEGATFDLPSVMARKKKTVDILTRGVAGLLKKNGITRYQGAAAFTGARTVEVRGPDGDMAELAADHVIIATGSKVARLAGVEVDGDRVGTSTEALEYSEVPAHLVVIGAGAIGLELGSVWARYGSKVTVVEYLDRILPGADHELAVEAQKIFTRQGMEILLGERVLSAVARGDECVVERDGKDPITCDRVLLATGRVPNIDGLGLDAVGVQLDEHGRVPVDDKFATTAAGIYAIGDVIRGPMLAHKAAEEGVACVEQIVTGWGHVDYDAIPSVVYTDPELAWVGQTEDELESGGIPFRTGSIPFTASGRARVLGRIEGRVKVIAHRDTDRVLGVHILGPHAGDLVAEAATAMSFGASSEDIARVCHAHPTLAEVIKEAALAVDGRAIHK